MYFLDRAPQLDSRYIVSNVEVAYSDEAEPPLEAAWQKITLPLQVPSEIGPFGTVWLRFQFSAGQFGIDAESAETFSVLFPSPYANIEVFLDGQSIGRRGSMVEPIAYYRRDLMFSFNSLLLKPRDNEIYLRLVRPLPGGRHQPFFIGPQAVLEPVYANNTFLKLRLPQVIMIAMTLMSLAIARVYLMRPSESAYGVYSVMVLIWVFHHSHDLIVNIPGNNHWLWISISYVSLGWFVAFAAVFVNRFINLPMPRVERAIFLGTLAGSIVLLLAAAFTGYASTRLAQQVWVPCIMLVGLYTFIQLMRSIRLKTASRIRGLVIVSSSIILVGFRDYLFELRIPWIPGSGYYLQYSSAVLLGFFSLVLVRRFADALEQSEHLKRDLEDGIADKSRELEANYARLKEVERQRTLSSERERIMDDMHDGLGGQLVQALAQVEMDQKLSSIEPILNEALQDLRLIIDSLAKHNSSLITLLANFRHRVAKSVERCGLKFCWHVESLPPDIQTRPSITLQVLRILQEAVTNVIKHASASTLTISAALVDDEIEIKVVDDGRGFSMPDEGHASGGYGLANMHRRADRIGAHIVIESDSSGTVLRLILPNTSSA